MTAAPEMVERVARAIAGHFGPDFDNIPKDRIEQRAWRAALMTMPDADNTQEDMLDAARAAIEALREPTEAMVAGWISSDRELAAADWRAMIDAALAKPSEARD